MARNLLVVESPAKARTIKKYLGADYEVLASYGHVRDLIPKNGAVEPENGFLMHYQPVERNEKHVSALSRAMKKAKALYLATDPDREGEAISWHVVELLRSAKVLEAKPVHRVVFHEITKRAIEEAVAHPREISVSLVNAQQARRALDYLVGFNLSPLLWKKIRPGLSAGRVQSPALRMIVEREDEIERFEKREYWTIEADLESGAIKFVAKLVRLEGEKLEQFSITDEANAVRARNRLAGLSSAGEQTQRAADAQNRSESVGGALCVHSVVKKQQRRNPAAPFITSTLQQEAARKLGFTANHTMRVAQQLYEGIDTGEGAVGLITYMRTDSTTLAVDAVTELREYIAGAFGADNVPSEARVFRTRAKNAQEAHEAIRPTSVLRTPESLSRVLVKDQAKLYELVWKRTVACQMRHATIDTVAVEFTCGAEPRPGTPVPDDLLRSTGSSVAVPGFLAVYEESLDDKTAEKERRLPQLEKGAVIKLDALRSEQHFTEPPPRYSEARLIRTLEDYGIGRPSTYASIVSTLQQREYVELENRRFRPTDVGRLVNAFVTKHFADYVDYDFTARLEDDLDAVSRGEREWVPLLKQFWEPFHEKISEKEISVTRADASQARTLGADPESGRPVSVRVGRYGPYAQIGTVDDEDKPRFASLQRSQRVSTITLQEALELFELPRELGATEDGEPVSANVGRFGPYVKYGEKFASLGPDDDPYKIDLARALEIVADKKRLPRELGATGDGEPVSVNIGRFGPYVKYGEKFASLGPEDDPYKIDLAHALKIVAEKKRADAEREIKVFEGESIRILKGRGRYGPYISDGKKNVRVPKDLDPIQITLDEAKELIKAAPPPRPRQSKKSRPRQRKKS